LIKYSNRLSPELTNLYKEKISGAKNNYIKKRRGFAPAVQIACAIAGNSKISMQKI